MPVQIDRFSPTEMLVVWSNQERFSLSFFELRFHCPCAVCVDEHTGKRILKKEAIPQDIRPKDIQIVGRYAIQVNWSDGHQTGIYHFDRLHELCKETGHELPP